MQLDFILQHLDTAYRLACKKKQRSSEKDDIWSVRFAWPVVKAKMTLELSHSEYVFSPVRVIEYKPDKYLHSFTSQDYIVLKALSLSLFQHLPRCTFCHSWKGHGGVNKAINRVKSVTPSFYYKTDVQNYYASIAHHKVLQQLSPYIVDSRVCRLLYCALKNQGGEIGLPRGSPLSHLLGNFYLHELDAKFTHRPSQTYVRYMDDIMLLSEHKGALRRGIKTINHDLNQLGLTNAYHKSMISHTNKTQTRFLGAIV